MNKWLYLKAYDNYNEQTVIIWFSDDDLNWESSSSAWTSYRIRMFVSWETEDTEINRWSDLSNIEIITEKEAEDFNN